MRLVRTAKQILSGSAFNDAGVVQLRRKLIASRHLDAERDVVLVGLINVDLPVIVEGRPAPVAHAGNLRVVIVRAGVRSVGLYKPDPLDCVIPARVLVSATGRRIRIRYPINLDVGVGGGEADFACISRQVNAVVGVILRVVKTLDPAYAHAVPLIVWRSSAIPANARNQRVEVHLVRALRRWFTNNERGCCIVVISAVTNLIDITRLSIGAHAKSGRGITGPDPVIFSVRAHIEGGVTDIARLALRNWGPASALTPANRPSAPGYIRLT